MDKNGKTVSDNFYWRGNKRTDFTAINSLPKVNLKNVVFGKTRGW